MGYSDWESTDIKRPSYFYWPTVQALRALEAVRMDSEAVAKGYSIEPDTLSFHIDVLISGINIIARPSELNDRFKRLPGFSSDMPILSEFATDILPAIKPNISSADARALLPKLEEIYDTLNRISKTAWDQDSKLKEEFFDTIQAGYTIILIIAALLACAILSFVIISIFYWWAIMAKTRALAAAEAAVADKIDFLAMVSHELRTPLQVIVSALDILERPQDVNTRSELTARIRRAANSLAVQLRDMLTLARAQTGYIELQPGVFEAGELVREVVENYQAAAKAKHLELRQTGPDEAVFVVADSERIAQLLHNLVSNAVKYTPTGYVEVDLAAFDEAAGELALRVTDTGPGLPPQIIENSIGKGLFSLGSGRGIGLSVVQTLLRQLGARMAISSPSEGGSIFELAIPAVPAAERSHDTSDARKRVLVVDDHPDLLKGLSSVLEELGFVTDMAPSGITALNFVAAHIYSVIFIDLDMPIMTGSALAAQIRKTDLRHKTKLVAMSAAHHGSKHDLSLFDAVLNKPIRRQQLLTIMQF
ncbi:hybrid sensor histidine kinase/response regulator [Rhizobium rhizogenes]|uniref:hybrid sensor histidine kinase/response regulator n=1 Tax=Rhizobium rhizogenes TaxID=359 RepID=UPI0015729DA0|nr:hybrid sensor histidine kinase/response regulator [Rhizobium rhizogenes]NTH23006.1 hybrid sensor histidine kinase/response regulator [Rhizobium rhizogenes]NTH36036.1 hybrid sensor histidine kinase/response regulator [Rhizobium rhizogenes]